MQRSVGISFPHLSSERLSARLTSFLYGLSRVGVVFTSSSLVPRAPQIYASHLNIHGYRIILTPLFFLPAFFLSSARVTQMHIPHLSTLFLDYDLTWRLYGSPSTCNSTCPPLRSRPATHRTELPRDRSPQSESAERKFPVIASWHNSISSVNSSVNSSSAPD